MKKRKWQRWRRTGTCGTNGVPKVCVPEEKTEEEEKRKEPRTVSVIAGRKCEVAGHAYEIGDAVTKVKLLHGISLNQFVDAVRGKLLAEKPPAVKSAPPESESAEGVTQEEAIANKLIPRKVTVIPTMNFTMRDHLFKAGEPLTDITLNHGMPLLVFANAVRDQLFKQA